MVEDLMRVQYLIILLVLLEHISFEALLEEEEVHDDPHEHLVFVAYLEAEPFLERLPLPVKGVEGIHSLLYLVDFIAYEIHIT